MRITARRAKGAAGAMAVLAVSGALVTAAASAATTTPAKATVLKLGSSHLVAQSGGAWQARIAATLLVSGKPLAGQKVSVLERKAGATAWTAVPGTLTTTVHGVVVATVKQPNSSEQYEFVFTATRGYTASRSPILTLTTPAHTSLKISALHLALTAAQKYQNTLTGVLTVGKTPLTGRKAALRERATGVAAWTILTGSLVTNSGGVITRDVTQVNKSEEYQFTFAGDAKYGAVVSSILTVTRP